MSPGNLAPAVRYFVLLVVGKCQFQFSARTPGIVKEVFYDFVQPCGICAGNISKRFLNQLQVYSSVLMCGHNKFAKTKLMCAGFRAWDSSIGAVTGPCWTTHESWFDSYQGQEIFLSSKASRPKMEPTQPPSQCVLEELSSRCSGCFMYLIIHLHRRPRLRMRGAVPPHSVRLTCLQRSNFNLSSCKGFKLYVFLTRSSRFNL
jgi:hypothetical protein